MKRLLILLALAVIVGLPFALRPKQRPPERADNTLVIITPHNEAIRHEFGLGFQKWYKQRTGRSVTIDWRVIGGTSDITRYLAAEYEGAFRNYWTKSLHQPWSTDVEASFANGRLDGDASTVAKAARAAFLASNVGCGIDLFFGGGSYDFDLQAMAGRIVPMHVRTTHPEWFRDEVIPRTFAGETYWDQQDRWVGNVLSNYGILFNRDALARLGIKHPPEAWADLADPRYTGELALADPTKSSSIAKAFENLIQQQMQHRLAALRAADPSAWARAPKEVEAQAVREGWLAAMRLIQAIGANARYFTDSSQKPPIDVGQGDCAAGICIDFYGRSQEESVEKRESGEPRLGFATPRGGTVSSVDPIAILRGAPHREVAELFIEYTLTMDGQKLWNFRVGTPGGPVQFALRRLPVRRDFYAREDWKRWRSDPEANPYGDADQLISRPEWTGSLYREMTFVIRIMTLDTHDELARAWRVINQAPEPNRTRALAALQDLSAVSYDRTQTRIKQVLDSRNKVDEVIFARELGQVFRANYAQAETIARQAR